MSEVDLQDVSTSVHGIQYDERNFKAIIKRYHISQFFAKKLHALADFRIVFILDDSGSMNEYLDESPLNRGNFKATRWDELQEFIKISIDIANTLNPDGCDVHFLNRLTKKIITLFFFNVSWLKFYCFIWFRPMVKNVNKFEELKCKFKTKPGGFTPMSKILNIVLKNDEQHKVELNEKPKKMLIVIVTDGEPTNMEGNRLETCYLKGLQREAD